MPATPCFSPFYSLSRFVFSRAHARLAASLFSSGLFLFLFAARPPVCGKRAAEHKVKNCFAKLNLRDVCRTVGESRGFEWGERLMDFLANFEGFNGGEREREACRL